jgi:membrane protease YdiL (CAAX protease family)
MASRRAPLAAFVFALGICVVFGTCSFAAEAGSGLRSVSLAGLGVESGLVLLALAGALLSSRSLGTSLGLLPSALTRGRLLLLVVGTLALSHALDCVLELSGLREDSALAALDEVLRGARGAELVLALVAMAGAPAFGEELLCRGWIQRGLAPRIGPACAVAVAALIFGLLHLDPVHALFAVFLGLYLGTIASWAGSTWPSILCHGVNNFLAVLLASGLAGGPPHSAPGAILGFAVAGGALLAARPRRRDSPAISAQRSGENLQPDARSDDP